MKGKVYLIGAGPGDEGLITAKGLSILKEADVIVYDRLANPSLLNNAKDNVELIYVGKASSDHTLTQDEINQVIVDKAKEGKIVARLKGGDPYVFGRGGEEGEYLLENGLNFEVVPGITSAIGGLAYAGIPITHRDYASSFHVFTGHFKDDDRDHNWKSVSKLKGTLVFLMGLANIGKITDNLMEHGYDKDQKAAVIMEAARPTQRVVTGTVETIARVAKENKIKSPALVVIGGVVNLHGKLSSPLDGPLRGKTVLVTRARKQSSSMVEKLKRDGANVIELPAIKINEIVSNEDFKNISNKLNEYSHIVFTSVNGVRIFMDKLIENGMDSRKLANAIVVS
ncbi:MAG: uroporphyrinogen-III C-methyltransferase, partial [Acidaminobacteraceae bacterium]